MREQLHARVDCTASAIDLPGHADRPLLHDQNAFEQLVDALRTEVTQPSILVGYSLGGRIALHAALRSEPSLPLRGLVLEGANPGIDAPDARAQRAALDAQRAEDIERHGLSSFLDRWYQLPMFGFSPHENAARARLVAARAAHKDHTAIAKIMHDASPGRVPSLWPELAALSMPLAYIHGKRDKKYAAIAENVRRQCPQAESHAIPNAGHNAHRQNPEDFARIVAAFVQKHGA